MLQQRVQRHAELWAAIHALTKDPRVRDGNPRAQAKLEARIKKLGVLDTNLIPGKRRRYTLQVSAFAGWDPQRDAVIEPGDPIPKKPWVCVVLYTILGGGQGRARLMSFLPHLFLTHHCLSRSAQRWNVRTVADLSATIHSITAVALEYFSKRLGEGVGASWLDTPPEGVRLPMSSVVVSESAKLGSDTVIVVEKHETREALVVSTVLD
jgi:hypothetical protein